MKYLFYFLFYFWGISCYSQDKDGITYTTGFKKIDEISKNTFLSFFFTKNCINLSDYQIVNFGELTDTLNYYKKNKLIYDLQVLEIINKIGDNNYSYKSHNFISDHQNKKNNTKKIIFGDWYLKKDTYYFSFYIVN